MNKKKEIVPKLRFPEFKNNEFWLYDFLGCLSTVLRGGSPRPIDEYLTSDTNSMNWLKIGDINKEDKYITKTSERVKKQALDKTRVVHSGDLIMSNSMSFGRPYLLKISTCIHDGWIAITEINSNVNKEYLYYYILSDISQIYFMQSAAGGGIKNLNAEIIKKLIVLYPENIIEQQKIADCLSSLDELIDTERRKLKALEKYKKGLMQKLFPAEGKTLPEWRFPEFQGCGEWKLQKLKLICDFQEGYAFSSSDFVTNDTDSNYIQVVRITDINNKNSNTDKVFVNMDLIKRNDLYKYLISKNDLILSLTGAAGFNFFIWNTNIAVLNQRTLKLIPKDEKNHAIKFLIEPLIHKEINMHGTGQNNNLSKEVLKNVEIVLPTSFKEQQKIADCLSEIDKIITEQSNKVEQLKAHKKGLMQGLFPSLEEADV